MAVRAGTTTNTYNGDHKDFTGKCSSVDPVLGPIAWYCANSGQNRGGASRCYDLTTRGGPKCAGSQPVAGKKANAWGLHDMLGNVYEWIWDFYSVPSSAPVTDPVGPANGINRICRGGNWNNNARDVRSPDREEVPATYKDLGIGLRLVRTYTP